MNYGIVYQLRHIPYGKFIIKVLNERMEMEELGPFTYKEIIDKTYIYPFNLKGKIIYYENRHKLSRPSDYSFELNKIMEMTKLSIMDHGGNLSW